LIEKALTVMKKDYDEIKKSRQVIAIMILLPAIFVLIALITYGIMFAFITNKAELLEVLPLILPAYNIMLQFLPIMIPSYIAADSFVGEKERKTLEALLIAPISDRQLLLGKILVSLIPTLLITFSFNIIYIIGTDILQLIFYNELVFMFPDLGFLIGNFGHSTILCLLTIELMVIISLRVKSLRDAQQIGGIIIIPVVGLMMLPFLGIDIYSLNNNFSIMLLTIITLVYIAITVILFILALKVFQRNNIITKI
jgi:ABC-type Na+ efflux pump permease subunit